MRFAMKLSTRNKIFIHLTFLSLLTVASCSASGPEYSYTQPPDLGDGLASGTLDQVGIDEEIIAQLIDRIRDGKYSAVHSLLIYKDDKLVLEDYFPGHVYQWDGPNHN